MAAPQQAMGNSKSKMQMEPEAEGEADPETTTYVTGLELAISKTIGDLEKQREVVAEKEERYLDTKQKFVQAMGIGPNHYNQGRAREWAENQGIAAMLVLDKQKKELKALELQLVLLRFNLGEAKAKAAWRARTAAGQHQHAQSSPGSGIMGEKHARLLRGGVNPAYLV
ncbi:hypothetical protein DOTSEDRAFT_23925 [Dothistroma septosporum NZE10]|uniref:Uncharacterized protein n=1 Tax=Dothistroma septosporum (strain NZE10 / CBS 128990) TaxID=675120 RepID=N1PN37_DOTSN|nr:hypothetical protein DOTSEDRAFT_23925 [Dothistroma septosporum NZE10]